MQLITSFKSAYINDVVGAIPKEEYMSRGGRHLCIGYDSGANQSWKSSTVFTVIRTHTHI